MSTRVEDDARKAADAERLQQKVQKEAREAKTSQTSREAFGKLVKTGQATAGNQAKAARAQVDAKKGEGARQQTVQKEAQANNRATQASRGGIQQHSKAMEQARSFQGVLTNQQSTTAQNDQALVKSREKTETNDTVERDDNKSELKQVDARKDLDAEDARVERAQEQARPNAAIDGNDFGESDQRGRERGGAQGIQKASELQAAQGPAAAHEVKQIPRELIDKLVSAIYVGVNDKGLKEFQIELKDGPMKGASMRISADDGKVSLRIDGLDGNTKRLVEASKGELMRRLQSKGLTLSRLDVK